MSNSDNKVIERRRAAMSVLAQSARADIVAQMAGVVVPAHEELRSPESGLVMLRGRIGGDGATFNVGEASVSRAAIRLPTGEVGFGYVLGRDGDKARLIALCDALIQSPQQANIEQSVIAPLKDRLAAAIAARAAETAATRVDFYTLVRGEG